MNAPHYQSRQPRHDPQCECGHGKRYHPYVGRIASWPTRCTACECKCFTATTEANPTVQGQGRQLGGEANPSNEGRAYGALARASAMIDGHPTWWEVTRWPE